MGKGINKLSKSQKSAPPKSQTRISAFFGRAPAAPATAASDVITHSAGAVRRSPRKRPAPDDVISVAKPLSTSQAVPAPPCVIDLDDSCEVIPNNMGRNDAGSEKENCLTGISDWTSATEKGLDSGAGAGVEYAPSDDKCFDSGADLLGDADEFAVPVGTRLVQRLTKRPRNEPDVSPDRKRSNVTSSTAGDARNPPAAVSHLRRSPRKLNGPAKSLTMTNLSRRSPRKPLTRLPGESAPRKGRDAVSVDLERALLAGEAAAGVPVIKVSPNARTSVKLIASDEQPYGNDIECEIGANAVSKLQSASDLTAVAVDSGEYGSVERTEVRTVSEGPRPVKAEDAGCEVAVAAITPQKRPPCRTPEPEEASALLFDSMADLFSSPFKEEGDCRSEVTAPLRSSDPGVPAWQRFDRYTVSFVERLTDGSTVLSLRATEAGQRDRSVTLRGSWSSTRVAAGDTVHVLHTSDGDVIDNLAGQLVVRPDRLLSGTSVVSAVFCARKAVLSELFRGLEPGNKAMLVGTMVHQLFQEVMRNRLCTASAIRSRVSELLRQNSTVSAAYGGNLSSAELAEELDQFVAPILAWVRRYAEWGRDAEVATPIQGKVVTPAPRSDEIWDGRVTALKDIEENYWSPRLGIKGKIDLTVEVKCRKRPTKVLPLELKTGRPTFSAEHQGQVTLYSMMTSERRPDPGAGLLLYLRTGGMREVATGPHNQRDLLQLRNELVYFLSAAPAPADPASASADPAAPADPASASADPAAASADPLGELELPPLPEVIGNERACQKCPHLVACSAYQRPSDPPHAVPDGASHLSRAHLAYFLRWSLLLRLEAAHSADQVSMARLWCLPAAERQARGHALARCRLLGARRTPAGWVHRVQRPPGAPATQLAVGDLVMVGTDLRLAVCMGNLTELSDTEAAVLLDRDLTSYPGGADELYHVDKCEYQVETSMGTYFSSLARLLDNSEHSRRLRELLIDRRPPSFLPGLGRLVITKCRDILRPLNKLQQRALLRVMMAEDYLLIQGMPGTGKTSTIVALVRLLVTMGRSVLLASYTHSAVDTVLLKLKEHFTDFVRLGRAGRVHAELQKFSAEIQTQSLTTPEEMEKFYDSKPVVATTCLGTNHPVFQRRKFDICIIDEASQIVQPAAIAPALLAGRFVLVGDPEQLPPVIQSPAARRRGMDECLFSRLAADGNTVQLTLQYRMNRALTAAANHLTYDGRLSCGSETVDAATVKTLENRPSDPVWLSSALDPSMERSLLMLDTSDLDWRHSSDAHGAVSNAAEAALVAHIAAEMVERGLPAADLGVIAPYRGQVKLLRAALPTAVEVNTVDQYQGRDKSVILYSCTRTAARRTDSTGDRADGMETTDILSDHRRLTVAVTRAKHKLVLVGRRDALTTYPPFTRLFGHLAGEWVLRLTAAQVSSLTAALEVS